MDCYNAEETIYVRLRGNRMISTFKTWFKPAAPKLKPPLIEDYNLESDTYLPKDFEIMEWSQEEMFEHILERLEKLESKIDKLL